MIRSRFEKPGQGYPGKAGSYYPAKEPHVANPNDNAPFDVVAWRRRYMREYMRRRRARSRRGEAPEPEKQPHARANAGNEAPPVKSRKPPPKAERKARWAARAEEMRTLADNMLMGEPRAMMERLAQDYERMSEGEE